jgi:hypothetical protein
MDQELINLSELDTVLDSLKNQLTEADVSSARTSLTDVAQMYGDRGVTVQQNMRTHASVEEMY